MVRHRGLVFDLIRREVVGRYRGSAGGLVWSFVHPLLMLAVYTFVFAVVFKARWGTAQGESNSAFAVILFMGLIVHALFAECINRAPGLILSNVNYVKRVIFPLEILPVVALGSAVFHMVVSVLILMAFQWFLAGRIEPRALWLPAVLLPLMILTLGVAWFLAATGVFVRDIAQTTGILTTVLMFLSPVFYPASSLPEPYRGWLNFNPLTFIIEQARAVVLWGDAPNLRGLALYTLAALVVFAAGYWWFQRTRPGFADVL
jgi:lipopolysaccharide transport system permease protein